MRAKHPKGVVKFTDKDRMYTQTDYILGDYKLCIGLT